MTQTKDTAASGTRTHLNQATRPSLDAHLEHRSGPIWDRLAGLPEDLRTGTLGNAMILLRHADGRAVLSSRDFVQGLLPDLGPNVDARFVQRMRYSMLNSSGDQHARLRRLGVPAFKPSVIDRVRPVMRATIRSLLNAVSGVECDAVAALTEPYTVPVICAALGVPPEEQQLFSRAAHAWTLAFFDPESVSAGVDTQAGLEDYIADLIEKRRRDLGEDMLSALISGNSGEAPSIDEATGVVSGLIVAGIDGLRIQLASVLEYLSRHPGLWQQLRDNAELIPAAVDEIIRLTPVAAILKRVAIRDTNVNGLDIPSGAQIALAVSVMNRDPDVFCNPHSVDLTRDTSATLSFGAGMHHCLGRQLGRTELIEAITALTNELCSLRPVGTPKWRPARSLQGPAQLPIRFARCRNSR